MLGLGVLFLVGGAYMGLSFAYMRMMAAGLIITGIGCIFCGLSDGFTDPTPRGVAFRKIGFAAFIIGVPILAYASYRFI